MGHYGPQLRSSQAREWDQQGGHLSGTQDKVPALALNDLPILPLAHPQERADLLQRKNALILR